jgi:AraC family transcriptional regulator
MQIETRHGAGVTSRRKLLAQGAGWGVSDAEFFAARGARFEAQHDMVVIAAVTRGSFRYRAAQGHVTLMPGALLLGNAGDDYECRYEDGGDRVIVFGYAPDYFARIAGGRRATFRSHRVAPTPAAIALTAAIEAEAGGDAAQLEELALRVAGAVCALDDAAPAQRPSARDERRIVTALDLIEARYAEPLSVHCLADAVRMSPFHFLRVFRAVAGVTPHQYLVRTRLRRAAVALATTDEPIAQVAFAHGFGDLSTFVTTFGRIFGKPPRAWRVAAAGAGSRPGSARRN